MEFNCREKGGQPSRPATHKVFVSGLYKFTNTAVLAQPLKAQTQVRFHDVFSLAAKNGKAEAHNADGLYVAILQIEGQDELVSSVFSKQTLNESFGKDLKAEVKMNTKSGVLTLPELLSRTFEVVKEDDGASSKAGLHSSGVILQREGEHTFSLANSGNSKRGKEVRDCFWALTEEERELLGGFHKTHVVLNSSSLKLKRGRNFQLLPDCLNRLRGDVEDTLDEYRRSKLLNSEALLWEQRVSLALEHGMSPEEVIKLLF